MAFDVAVGIEAVGALPGADVLLGQLIVLVVLAAQLNAIAPRQTFQRAERQVADVAGTVKERRRKSISDSELERAK